MIHSTVRRKRGGNEHSACASSTASQASSAVSLPCAAKGGGEGACQLALGALVHVLMAFSSTRWSKKPLVNKKRPARCRSSTRPSIASTATKGARAASALPTRGDAIAQQLEMS